MIAKTGFVALIFSLILGAILLPIIVLIFSFNEFARLIVKCLLLVKYNHQMELVEEGTDGYWGYKKKGSTRNVILFWVTPEGSLNQKSIAKFYKETIQNFKNGRDRPYEKFERIMITRFGYHCWKKETFNIHNHIRELDVNRIYSVKDVQKYLTEFGDDFDEDKPQWELIIMPKFDDGTGEIKSILFIRFLHAYTDGLSFLMLLKERVITSAEYSVNPLTFKMAGWKKLKMQISSWIYGPYFLVISNFERIFNKPWIVKDNFKEPRRKFYAWSKPITETMISKIRLHGKRSSISNVIAAAFTMAVKKVIPKELLVDELFITELMAILPYPDSRPRNGFGYFTYPVLSKGKKPYDTMDKIQRDSLKSLLGPDVLMNYIVLKSIGRLPSFTFSYLLQGNISSVIFSNIPYFKKKVSLPNGAPVLFFGGFAPHPDDQGLSIVTKMYGEELRIFAVADCTWMSQNELSLLVDQMALEIIDMAKEAGYEHDESEK